MSSLAFWKAAVQDKSNFLERVIQLLEESGYGYCVIGGVAVNAYSDPVVTQDLDVALSRADLGHAMFRLKLAAAAEPSRRARKRLKDLADLRRLIDVFPALESEVPEDLRSSLLL
ncbi:MAG: hypothetical protein AB7N24_22670 [Dehalococcoidia bacterium]